MTPIPRNLSSFIADTGTAIIGEKCYLSLAKNLDLGDVDCLRYSLSKGLGLIIVVAGSIMKLPQLILILSIKSTRGISLSAYILETLAYATETTYCYRNRFPFSTYGENFFITLQNILITFLIVYWPSTPHQKMQDTAIRLALTVGGIVAAALTLYVVPKEILTLFQLATLPLFLFSKLPQIILNARSRSTGQLSALAVAAQIVGCLTRLFTTITEVGDLIVTAGFTLPLILNIVIGVQMWMYWGKDDDEVYSMTPIGTVHKREDWSEAKLPKVDVVPPDPLLPPCDTTASPHRR